MCRMYEVAKKMATIYNKVVAEQLNRILLMFYCKIKKFILTVNKKCPKMKLLIRE